MFMWTFGPQCFSSALAFGLMRDAYGAHDISRSSVPVGAALRAMTPAAASA
jgi:hypothetical protein